MKTIYADFNNIDQDGCLRLNCTGTLEDLKANAIRLEEGMALTFCDGDLLAQAVVTAPSAEGVWRARLVGEVQEVAAGGGAGTGAGD